MIWKLKINLESTDEYSISWSRVLLEKLIVTQLVKKLLSFYGTVFTIARQF
jgi:hypothetical protein